MIAIDFFLHDDDEFEPSDGAIAIQFVFQNIRILIDICAL